MPIIYMHGVNTRDPEHFAPVREYLRRIVAPAIAPDPEKVSIRALAIDCHYQLDVQVRYLLLSNCL